LDDHTLPAPAAVPAEALKFELAAHEVVELLVGNKIYDNPPYVVVRELLQNSVDACRLRRAVEPGYEPCITVAYTPGNPGRLTVSDNGIGMTEHVVRRYFLQVGKSYYSSPDFRAAYGAYNFAPIARFGIGVLSCFLIADQVTLLTRHHSPGAVPLHLEMEGVHSLIARRPPPPDTPVGTTLTLNLRPPVVYQRLEEVVRHWARHVEVPVRVVQGGQVAVVPGDDGAGFRRQLLDP
jgi:HSP90 family molecular chaperone